MTPALRDALAAERDARFPESLRLVHEALAAAPDDPDALNLLGRLCVEGDLAAAIALQRLALRHAPAHAGALRDLARALRARPDPERARRTFADALALAPEIAVHHRLPWSLAPFPRVDEVRALIDAALRDDPALSPAHAARANLAVRDGRFADAYALYRRALLLDPDDATIHLAVAELAHALDDDAAAEQHRAQALARRRLFAVTPPPGAVRSVLVLTASDSWSAHVPLDLVVDHTRTALHRLYVREPASAGEALPRYDVVFSALREAESARDAIAAADRFIAAQTRPALNPPARLTRTARPALAATLAGIPGCVVPATRRRSRADLRAGLDAAFPLVIRPIDTHAGRGFARVDDREALAAYLDAAAGDAFDVAPFVDYRDPDGWYRKYRVIAIDGIPYPCHLAISGSWMVHYATSAMAQHAWMRAEEERFLDRPQTVFPRWGETFAACAAAIGLDYVGFDCARTPGGDVLIFEADAAMLVHALDPSPDFAYKGPAHARIVAALERAIDARR